MTPTKKPNEDLDKPVIERSFRHIWALGIGELKLHWPVVDDLPYTERLYIHAYFVARFVRPKYREQFVEAFSNERELSRTMFYRSSVTNAGEPTARAFPQRVVRARGHSIGLVWCHPRYDMSVRLMGRLPQYVASLTGMQGPVLGVFEPKLNIGFVESGCGSTFVVHDDSDASN